MSALESISLDTLSDDDAVALLFEMTGQLDLPRERLQQLDAVVYHRFVQAYRDEDPTALPATA